MASLSISAPQALGLRDRVAAAKRRPQRLTITVPYGVAASLSDRSNYEGRSISNLAACLLESALTERNL